MGRLLLLVTYKICLKSAGLYDFFLCFLIGFCVVLFEGSSSYEEMPQLFMV